MFLELINNRGWFGSRELVNLLTNAVRSTKINKMENYTTIIRLLFETKFGASSPFLRRIIFFNRELIVQRLGEFVQGEREREGGCNCRCCERDERNTINTV